jgi:uroporphyrinogen-III decarboxylase
LTTHTPTINNLAKPQGLARDLYRYEKEGLRAVTGAFRATPIRSLHIEAAILPFDLYLNATRLKFKEKIVQPNNPIREPLREASIRIKNQVLSIWQRQRRRTRLVTLVETRLSKQRKQLEKWKGFASSAEKALYSE